MVYKLFSLVGSLEYVRFCQRVTSHTNEIIVITRYHFFDRLADWFFEHPSLKVDPYRACVTGYTNGGFTMLTALHLPAGFKVSGHQFLRFQQDVAPYVN